MRRYRIVYEISKWEFFRWFKLKDQILTLVISCGIGFLIWGGIALLGQADRDPVTLFVVNDQMLPLTIPETSRLTLQRASADSQHVLREAVARREIEGLLIIKSEDAADLVVHRRPEWQDELAEYLTQARTQSKIQLLEISREELAEAIRPFSVDVVVESMAGKQAGTAEKIAAGVVIALMLLGVFVSFAYQFVTITGEKQLRVTEQIISAVSPQQWIDGKILGLSAFAFASTITYVLSILVFIGISGFFGELMEIPGEVTSLPIVVALAFLGLTGYLFWNTFFATLAATINDPNTSARGSLVFVPVLATVGAAVLALKSPDSVLTQVLAIFPATAPAALAGRLVLTDVPLWEVFAAFVLMLGAIWFMRTAAGKIFHLGMLMYGKEPSWRELLRWIREA